MYEKPPRHAQLSIPTVLFPLAHTLEALILPSWDTQANIVAGTIEHMILGGTSTQMNKFRNSGPSQRWNVKKDDSSIKPSKTMLAASDELR